MKIKQLVYVFIGFTSITANIAAAQADEIKIKLAQPSWEFELPNGFKSHKQNAKRNKITRGESQFVHKIQPLLNDKKYPEAIRLFDKFEAENEPLSPNLYELMGQILISAKQYKRAEHYLLTALNDLPNSVSTHRHLSLVYMQLKAYPKAQQHLVKTLALGQSNAQIYGQLAFVNLQLGLAVSAISGYQNALMLDPDNKQWYQGLLYAYIKSGSLNQASNIVEDMLVAEPNNKQLWLQRGQIALKQGEHLKALASLETALAAGESNIANLISVAKLQLTHGSATRAVEIVETHTHEFIDPSTPSSFNTLKSIADHLAFNNNWSALNHLINVVNAQQLTQAQALDFYLIEAKLALEKNQTKQASQLLERVVKQRPTEGQALMMLAEIYRDNNNSEKANLYYVRAQALPKYKEKARLGRAQIAINQKNYQQALMILRRVYRENPDRSELVSNIKSLEKLLNLNPS